MSAEQLITDHLDLWTSAVTYKSGRGAGKGRELTGIKKLRELILELAVRGRLVEQDPNDEPASVLLEKIAEEKAWLVKEGKIKKPKKLPEITEEIPFKIPNSWAWVRLGEVSLKLTDGSHNPPTNAGTGFPMLSSQNVNFGRIDFSSPSRYVSEDDFNRENSRTLARPGDVLLTIVASLGRAAVVPEGSPQFVLQRSVAVINSPLNPQFLTNQLLAPACLQYYETNGKGTAQKGIYLGKLSAMPVAIPPLKEQHRIVAKVDELMALCDRLEQQTGDQLDAHEVLVDTLLDALTRAEDADEMAAQWARLAENFDTLFTTEASIDKLKQAILQLAVMGRLVEQDPNDEPASVLLEKIAEEKARLVEEGKIKKTKKHSSLPEKNTLFSLPQNWTWTNFEEISDPEFTISYGVLVPGEDTNNGVPLVRVADLSMSNSIPLPQKKISHQVDQKFSKTRLHGGEILLCVVGSIGKLGVAPDSWRGANIARAICRIMPSRLVSKGYILMLLQTEFMQKRFGKDTRTLAQPTLNVGLIKTAATPVPPIEEQHRIVAKADKLMALCDQLKARLSNIGETRTHLAETMVAQAVE